MNKTITPSNLISQPTSNSSKNELTPHLHTIRNILNYSKALSIIKTSQLGTIELLKN
ncbi:MAG: hypothetical protein J0M08_13565 [Bacteroidetes bacterium]|nr:hypothetical protein [Bacteroidota bacterium]